MTQNTSSDSNDSSPHVQNSKLSEQAFSACLSLMGILIAVVGLLLAQYPMVRGTDWLEEPFKAILWGATLTTLLAAGTCSLALANLLGLRNPNWIVASLLAAILVLVAAGLPATVYFILYFNAP